MILEKKIHYCARKKKLLSYRILHGTIVALDDGWFVGAFGAGSARKGDVFLGRLYAVRSAGNPEQELMLSDGGDVFERIESLLALFARDYEFYRALVPGSGEDEPRRKEEKDTPSDENEEGGNWVQVVESEVVDEHVARLVEAARGLGCRGGTTVAGKLDVS